MLYVAKNSEINGAFCLQKGKWTISWSLQQIEVSFPSAGLLMDNAGFLNFCKGRHFPEFPFLICVLCSNLIVSY